MSDITPIVRTHVINRTKQDIKYNWYPPHGLYVGARKTVVVDGDVMALATKLQFKKLLASDLAHGRVKLAIEVVDQKGVAVYKGATTVNVAEQVEKPAPAPKAEVKKAQKEAEVNEQDQKKKLEDIKTGRAPIEPFSETFQDKTIEEMKPPVQDIFPPDAFGEDVVPTKKADVEVVDMFGAEAFSDKTKTTAEKDAAEAELRVKRSEAARKAAATRKANKAKKSAAGAAETFGEPTTEA